MGFGEHFPWKAVEDFYDYRLSKSGKHDTIKMTSLDAAYLKH